MITTLLLNLYAVNSKPIQTTVIRLVKTLENGEMYSPTLRRIFLKYHDIRIGRYSYGGCFDAQNIASGTTFGAYCSIARPIYIFNGNHPLHFRSTHPFFFNPKLGLVETEQITRKHLTVGNDVWIGCNAIILPSVTKIGDGAVIGAGSVVITNVPPFAVVFGNPATIIKYRFSSDIITGLLEAKWWTKSIDEIIANREINTFTKPLWKVKV